VQCCISNGDTTCGSEISLIYAPRILPREAIRMEIAVCVKMTYDVQELKADSSGRPSFQNVLVKISEFDKYAIEAAVKLREGMGGTVRLFSVSNANAKEAIKEALARGCDSGFIVHYDQPPQDPAMIARLLASAITKHAPQTQIVLCGEASVDMSSSVVGSMVAACLDQPFVAYASKLQVQGENVLVERSGGGTVETLSCKLPVVIGATDKLNKPRTPTLMQILGAAKKPVSILTPNDVAPEAGALTKFERVEVFKMDRKRVMVDASDAGAAADRVVAELRKEGAL